MMAALWPGEGFAGNKSPNLNAFRIDSGFEQAPDGSSLRYRWHNEGATASLSAGGTLTVRTNLGEELRISFPGANMRSEPQGEVPTKFETLYYLGASKTWRKASSFERVRYREIYPGIDLIYLTTGNHLEYNFRIGPHGDSQMIRIHSQGSAMKLTRDGGLKLRIGHAVIVQRRPRAFQYLRGRMRSVPCEYHMVTARDATIRLEGYNPAESLLIDPVLDFSTYLGGSSFDSAYAAATDAAGNLYVTGETSSGSLLNAALPPRSSRDAFLARFNSAGNQVAVVYLGGSNYDSGRGITLDPSGNVYLTGITKSSDFPVTKGAYSTTAPGVQNAFVAKFNSKFALQYATYLGGGSADAGLAIASDSSGAVYVTGQTQSPGFPVTSGAVQSSFGGGISDCFVTKLNSAGTALVYSTFLGGSGLDFCAGIAVESDNAYVTGTTASSNFPLVGALQGTILGSTTAFVAELNATATALVYSTYLGGSNVDNANAIALDSTGAAYVTGATSSFDFPTTTGAFQTQLNGEYNAFVTKLSAGGSALVYSTMMGGSGSDAGTSLALDSADRAIIGGYTSSSNFPVYAATQSAFGGVFDAFAAVLNPAGTDLVFSSYFGGSGDDQGYAVAVGTSSNFYLAGVTSSTNFPVAAAIQSSLRTPPDAFVLEGSYLAGTPAAVSVTPSSGAGASQTFALESSDTAGAGSLQQVWVYFNATLARPATQTCLVYYIVATNQINLLNDTATAWLSATLGSAATLQNSQCSLNVGASSVTSSGNTLTLNLAMTFEPAYAGAKNVYMYAADVSGSNSGWQQLGTWTVPGIGTPAAVSVSPSSGSGASQTFALESSDTAGAGSLQQVWVYFNATLARPATQTCLVYYIAAANQINLLNDAATAWLSATLGSAATLQNSQCSLNVGASSVTSSGNTLTLNLAMTFEPGYAGAKNVYMYAADISGSNSGWQQLGTWMVP